MIITRKYILRFPPNNSCLISLFSLLSCTRPQGWNYWTLTPWKSEYQNFFLCHPITNFSIIRFVGSCNDPNFKINRLFYEVYLIAENLISKMSALYSLPHSPEQISTSSDISDSILCQNGRFFSINCIPYNWHVNGHTMQSNISWKTIQGVPLDDLDWTKVDIFQ